MLTKELKSVTTWKNRKDKNEKRRAGEEQIQVTGTVRRRWKTNKRING
jgi:hypothetical protein